MVPGEELVLQGGGASFPQVPQQRDVEQEGGELTPPLTSGICP
jgi:hypothetical protein